MLRRTLRVLVILAALVVGLVALALVATQTPWFKERVRRLAVGQANRVLNGELSIGRLEGNLFTRVTLSDVVLRQEGRPSITIAQVEATYDVTRVASNGVTLDGLALERPVIVLRRMGDGWNLGRLLAPRPSAGPRRGPRLTFNRISLTGGQFVVEPEHDPRPPRRFDEIDTDLALSNSPDGLRIAVNRLSFVTDQADLAMRSFTGTMVFDQGTVTLDRIHVVTAQSDFEVHGSIADFADRARYGLDVEAARVWLPEWAGLLPALRNMRLNPVFGARVDGPASAMQIRVRDLRSEAGQADGSLLADFVGPDRALSGTLAVQDVDLAPIFDDAERQTHITGDVTFDLHFPPRSGEGMADGTYRFQGPVARAFGYEAQNLTAQGRVDGRRVTIASAVGRAYGARVRSSGTLDVPVDGKPLALDLRGRVQQVDMRRVPRVLDLPRLATSLDLDYYVHGPEGAIGGDATFHAPSVVEGTTVGEGSVARFAFRPRRFDYQASGTVTGLDLQRLGRALDVEALAADRFRSQLGGQFDARGTVAPDTPAIVSGSGRLVDSTIMGGELPELRFKANMADNSLDVTADGRFVDYDLETLFDVERVTSRLTGSADVRLWFPDVRAPLTPEYLDVSGLVALQDSEVAGVTVNAMEAKGDYEKGVATFDTLSANGPGYSLTGAGTASLDEETPWSVTYRIVSDDVEPLARRIGQPVKGAATVEGRITGRRSELTTTGTLEAQTAAYGARFSIAQLDSTFQLVLPELDVARLRGEAKTRASRVGAPGVELQTLTADATYADRTLDFRASALESRGSIETRGRASLLDGRQEVQLEEFSIERRDVVWRLPPDREARIVYDKTTVTVAGVELVNRAQRLAVDGLLAIGDTSKSELEVTAERVDLSQMDDLTIGDRGMAGMLDGRATIRGTPAAPLVNATLDVRDGAYGDYEFQSLAGTVRYDGALADVDLQLQQDANARLTARGVVPKTLFQPRAEAPAGHVAASARDRLDVTIQAQQFSLALIDELVPQIQQMQGTASADLRLTNAGLDPHIVGSADLANVRFTLPATGLRYQGGHARLRFQPERLRIEEFQLLDPQKQPLAVTGQMALHGGDIGEFVVRVKAQQFALVNNEYANLDADLNLRIDGELLRPRVQGDVTVRTSEVEVDRLLERFGAGTYAAEPIRELPELTIRPGEEISVTVPPPRPSDLPADSETPPGDRTEPSPEPSPGPGGVARLPSADAEDQTTERPSAFASSALNVRVRIPDNMILRGQSLRPGARGLSLGDINATVGGDFRVAKSPGEPVVLIGSVNMVRGQYTFQGRRFEIQRDGRITFRGGGPIDPGLDIWAERVIQGIQAQVHLHGTARQPELSLSSKPPLDEGDVLALIIFNQPASQLGQGQAQTLAESAGGLAAGIVVSPLAQTLGSALNIDLLEVQTTDEAGRISPSIVLGEQVGEALFVKFRQQFGAQQVSEFLLEYQLAHYLRWRSSVAEGEGVGRGANRSLIQRVERYGMDLIFYFAY
ncbi:MAG: hypothetical protein GEV06_00320 [Luteitalea sp.]|nr:hypothetical protein [Luteitalea sp.]